MVLSVEPWKNSEKALNGDYSLAGVFKASLEPGSDAMTAMKEAIRDLEEQVKSRLELHKKIMHMLDAAEIEVSNFLSQYRFGLETQEGREKMLLFKSKAIEVAQAKTAELVSCWQDINKLKEELRALKREFNEKKNRMDLLDKILEK
jgi:hypothetical protein